jgi:Double sensory domain of two-component sensor kinase
MFWSKTWFFLIALVGALAVAVALLATRPLQRDLEHETGARLERAQHSASLLLKVNARKWIDTAAQVATDAVLVEALDQATKGPADLGLVHRTVQERLKYFNDKMKVDLVMATDAHGRVIARAGLDDSVYKDGVEGFPLVADALRGYRGDDTWSQGGKLYRVAASPVIRADRYVGALVVGQEAAGELAQSMKRVLDVDVAFLLRGRVLAASAQMPLLGQLPLLVDQHFDEMMASGRSMPLAVDQGGESYLVVLAPFVGEAAEHKAAYALVVPRTPAATLQYLLEQLLATDPRTLPWVQLAPIGGALLVVLLIGFLMMRLEAQRPLKRLARDAQALARGDISRLDDDRHPGKFGTIARALNTTLDRLGTAARAPRENGRSLSPESSYSRETIAEPRQSSYAPPQEPFAPPPRQEFAPPRQEFAPPPRQEFAPPPRQEFAPPPRQEFAPPPIPRQDPFAVTRASPPQLPSMPRQTDMDAPSVPEFDSRATMARPRPQLDSIPMMRDDRPDTGELRPTQVRIDSRASMATPPPPPSLVQSRDTTDPHDAGPDFIESPSMPPILHRGPPSSPSPLSNLGSTGQKDSFDDQTAVASPSEALLRAAARDISQVGPNPVEAAALEAEFRQVYRDFIETKQACGEPIEGITYDKFSGKLRNNRQQLITRYSCKTVKFQVYIKDGKAALKATPVTA